MALNFPSLPLSNVYPDPFLVRGVNPPCTHIMPRPLAYRGYLPFNQNFEYFVVVDFEATCDKERIPHPQEMIEFPSVIVCGATGQIKACFQTYVRPTYNPVLTDFCKELTGIQQFQVDKGLSLSEALFLHDQWLHDMGVKNTKFAVVTWSNWDCQVLLRSECHVKNIKRPDYFNQWINLRIPFREVFGNVNCNLKEAVELSGLMWQGRLHSGLDDAINISHLFAIIMYKGYKFSITKSLPDTTQTCPLQHLPPQFLPPPLGMTSLQHIPDNPEDIRHCFCGARSGKKMSRQLGPKYGHFFYGCGNWTITRGACCNYFEWVNP